MVPIGFTDDSNGILAVFIAGIFPKSNQTTLID